MTATPRRGRGGATGDGAVVGTLSVPRRLLRRGVLAVLLLACAVCPGHTAAYFDGEGCGDLPECVTGVDAIRGRNETVADYKARLQATVAEMFDHGYTGYMRYAYPRDELRPVTCTGVDTLSRGSGGGFMLTLVDALDSLAVFGKHEEFCTRVGDLGRPGVLDFDLDLNVSVFETNIRMVGGLLGAHVIIEEEIVVCDRYDGELLERAHDLATRLLPAFRTTTGIPYGTINLRHGIPKGETPVTSLAGGGTFILEFGVLSVLTGDPVFERVARRATRALYAFRSPLGLFGNHIDIMTGRWTHGEASVGSASDSFYEYLAKGYALFNDVDYYDMFLTAHKALMQHTYRPPWFVEVYMWTGAPIWQVSNSLAAFYPGVMFGAGFQRDAAEAAAAFHAVWRMYGALPEGYSLLQAHPMPNQLAYPLRPEHAESLWQGYHATGDEQYLAMGADMVYGLARRTRTRCGFAVIEDITKAGDLRDTMESFMLSETLKYLYLLFDDGTSFLNSGGWVMNTEAHGFPVRVEFAAVGERRAGRRPGGAQAPFRRCTAPTAPSFTNALCVDGLRLPQHERVDDVDYPGRREWEAFDPNGNGLGRSVDA